MQCIAYLHGKCSTSHSIRVKKLEAMFLAALEDTLTSGSISLVRQPEKAAQRNTEVLAKQFAFERKKLVRIKDAYERGVDSLNEYRIAKQKIQEQINALKAQQADRVKAIRATDCRDFRSQHLQVLAQLKDPTLDASQKNILLRSFIDRIVFDRTKAIIQIYYYL